MAHTDETRSGGCQCGAVRYEARGAPKFVGNCHCRDCRKATGAAFSTYVCYLDANVRWTGDRLKASGGVGLFYFAGHGVQVNGENFLVSTDSDIRNEDEVADDAVNAQVVLEKMQSAGNRMNLIVLDACRNNPFAVKSRSAANGLATMNAPSGSLSSKLAVIGPRRLEKNPFNPFARQKRLS